LKEVQPECVIVATTAPTHCEYTCLAAQSGAKYILCEKPMAVSLAECNRMLRTCAEHGARLAVNHPRRFMERYSEAKRLVNSAAMGGLTSITVIAGNFGMAMNGTHYIEMSHYMAEEALVEVSAWFSPEIIANPRGPQFSDRAGSLRLSTTHGKRFYMEAGADQAHGLKVIFTGRYGQIIMDELAGTLSLMARQEQYRDLPATRYGMPFTVSEQTVPPADVLAPARAILQALLTDANPPSGEDGRLALQALVAAYLSDEQGHRSVKIAETDSCLERVFPWA
jgi:predicted dehydrogenase